MAKVLPKILMFLIVAFSMLDSVVVPIVVEKGISY